MFQHTFTMRREHEREAAPAQLTAHSSGSMSYIITSSNPTGTRWGRYCAFSHFQIKMLRSRRRSRQTQVHGSPGLSFVQGSAVTHHSCFSHSTQGPQQSEGCDLPLPLPRLFWMMPHEQGGHLDSSPSWTASNWKARCACGHSFSGNATVLQLWNGTAPTLGSLRYKFPCEHCRHFTLVFRLATNGDVITYCGCRRLWSQMKGSFYLVNCFSNIRVERACSRTGVHWFMFSSISNTAKWPSSHHCTGS